MFVVLRGNWLCGFGPERNRHAVYLFVHHVAAFFRFGI
jgi:hypothetical protein